jgi:hypothetical protein
MAEHDTLDALRAENARLVALLKSHSIEWHPAPAWQAVPEPELEPSRLSTAEKVALFWRLREAPHQVR